MEIKEQIIVLVKSKKSKTINIKEIRENLNLEYTPQNEKILKNEIEKLVQERYIEPQTKDHIKYFKTKNCSKKEKI